ncbi:MAG TPA: hypothetical protein VFV86_05380, partial [Nitrososphaeraceae archaeon]|nr:hypothetical protein [Nitrososphaeraceae archaeon]
AKKARDFVKKFYPNSAYKVFVRVNCQYNDSYYDINPNLLVLDKNFSELDPIKPISGVDSIFDHLTVSGYDQEVKDEIDDFSFLMIQEENVPELYIKEN